MPRKKKQKHHKKRGGYRPLYRAKKKKKAKFPTYLKKYYKCIASGKSKSYCKAHTPGYPK